MKETRNTNKTLFVNLTGRHFLRHLNVDDIVKDLGKMGGEYVT
jgi:hypothetical protein